MAKKNDNHKYYRHWGEFEERARRVIKDFDEKKEQLLMRLGTIYQLEVKKKITTLGAVDTGRLRSSIVIEFEGDSRVVVGTNVEYARFVNDGHVQHRRFVPGRWRGNNTFEYIPNYNEGMMLTERFVYGKKFMEKAMIVARPNMKREINQFMNDLRSVWDD